MYSIVLLSIYDRWDEYKCRFSLSTMRLAASVISIPDTKVVITPIELECSNINKIVQNVLGHSPNFVGLVAYSWLRDINEIIIKQLCPQVDIVAIGGPDIMYYDKISGYNNFVKIIGEGENSIRMIVERKMQGKEVCNTINIPYCLNYQYTPIFSYKFMNCLYGWSNSDLSFIWYDTAVGCPYKCAFCGHRIGKKCRIIAPSIVKEEIKFIGNIGVKKCSIVDPVFPYPAKHDIMILQLFKKYAPNTQIEAYYRLENTTEESVQMLADSNVSLVTIGLQTLNPNVPTWIRSNDLRKAQVILPLLSLNNIPVKLELIAGLPGDNILSLKKTMRKVIDEYQPSELRVYPLTVIDGTPLAKLLDNSNDDTLWIRRDKESRVFSSSSYSHQELVEMISFSSAVESLYNVYKMNKKKVSYEKIESEVMAHFSQPIFERAREKECLAYWKSLMK